MSSKFPSSADHPTHSHTCPIFSSAPTRLPTYITITNQSPLLIPVPARLFMLLCASRLSRCSLGLVSTLIYFAVDYCTLFVFCFFLSKVIKLQQLCLRSLRFSPIPCVPFTCLTPFLFLNMWSRSLLVLLVNFQPNLSVSFPVAYMNQPAPCWPLMRSLI